MNVNDQQIIDVQEAVRDAHVSAFHIKILLLCLGVLILDGFDTVLMGYVAPVLVHEWGVAKADLGIAMSAALIGLAVGALISGPVSDRFGRKPVIMAAMAVVGVFSIATMVSSGVYEISFWRFLTGIGIGGAMSNILTIVSEFAPERRRSIMVNAVFCGFPLGAAMSGLLGAWLIPTYGWKIVFFVGGIFPLLLLIPMMQILPESLLYLSSQRGPRVEERIRKITAKLMGKKDIFMRPISSSTGQKAPAPVKAILSLRILPVTLSLWVTYFMGLLVCYAVSSWMPILINDAGYDIGQAALLTALFPLGGSVGALLSGVLMDRVTPHRIVITNYVMAGVFLFSIGFLSDIHVLGVFILLAGVVTNGAQTSMGSIAALHYPTTSRATGIAWMLGIGRAGGIIGAFMGAWLLSFGLDYKGIFMVLCVPSTIAALALLYCLLQFKTSTK